MTLYQFNALDEAEQAEAIWDSVHIGERFDEQHNILLYQRDGFYIEVFHHREDNVIRRIRSFVNPELLQPYVSKIDLSEISNLGDA